MQRRPNLVRTVRWLGLVLSVVPWVEGPLLAGGRHLAKNAALRILPHNDQASAARRCRPLHLLLGGVVATSSHLVTKLHHAALVGFDLREMEGGVSVELLEEWDPITNQDRQDRITNFVG